MHAPERHSRILTELSRNASVSIRELTQILGVSRETVRKDLELLSKQGKVNQVRGGATRIKDLEPPLADRFETNPRGKGKIAQIVAELIPDGASVIIDSGSTTFVAAELLAETCKDLTVLTNDVHIAFKLLDAAAEVNIIGGRLDPRDSANYGLDAVDFVRRYRVDFALIGVAGLDERAPISDFSREAAALREAMIEASDQSYILADSSKFGRSGRVPMSVTGQASLISDVSPSAEILGKLDECSINLITPESFTKV